jgi:hypothetical protein
VIFARTRGGNLCAPLVSPAIGRLRARRLARIPMGRPLDAFVAGSGCRAVVVVPVEGLGYQVLPAFPATPSDPPRGKARRYR